MYKNKKQSINNIDNRIKSAKRLSIYLLIVLMFSSFTSVYFYHKQFVLKKELEKAKMYFIAQTNKIAELNEKLVELVKVMESKESPSFDMNYSENLIRINENTRYSVGLYGYKVPFEEFDKINTYIEKNHFSISSSVLLKSRTSWLARTSTVFYYDAVSKKKASILADSLEEITGNKFRIDIGHGLGVLKGYEKWTFFIHYIGK